MHLKSLSIQNLVQGDPVHARRFHRHDLHPALVEPIRQCQEVASKWAEITHRLLAPRRIYRHIVLALADINPRTIRIYDPEPFCLPFARHVSTHPPISLAVSVAGETATTIHSFIRGRGNAHAISDYTSSTVRAKLSIGSKRHQWMAGLAPAMTLPLYAISMDCSRRDSATLGSWSALKPRSLRKSCGGSVTCQGGYSRADALGLLVLLVSANLRRRSEASEYPSQSESMSR